MHQPAARMESYETKGRRHFGEAQEANDDRIREIERGVCRIRVVQSSCRQDLSISKPSVGRVTVSMTSFGMSVLFQAHTCR